LFFSNVNCFPDQPRQGDRQRKQLNGPVDQGSDTH